MKTYLMPIKERTKLDAIRIAAERTEREGRKFVARVSYDKFFVVPLYVAGEEQHQKIDAGYAAVGALIGESLR